MVPVIISNHGSRSDLLLTCEHASAEIPAEYDNLGLTWDESLDHIGWDIGAAAMTHQLSRLLDACAVLSGASRLLVDCNRDLTDHDLVPHESHGIVIPGNGSVDAEERERRLTAFYRPYHDAVDREASRREFSTLVSIHSFTPILNGHKRSFDVGVLFDDFVPAAEQLIARLSRVGFRVRKNEPYSALDGLIFSARHHGRTHGLRYLELEINNGLLRTEAEVRQIADRLTTALRFLVGGRCASS
jgi:predicted N-formylglutamate amidohydrolase